MQGYVADDVALGWITDLAARAQFVSLHFELPHWSDPTASEIVDSGYSRSPVSWEVLSNRSIGNFNPLAFTVSSSSSVVALGFHELLTDSTMVAYAVPPTGAPLTIFDFFVRLGRGDIVLGFT